MLALANELESYLAVALHMRVVSPRAPIRPSLRREINNLTARFSELRRVQVERMVGWAC